MSHRTQTQKQTACLSHLLYASRVLSGAPVIRMTWKPFRKATSGALGRPPGSAKIFTSGFISRSVAALASATLQPSQAVSHAHDRRPGLRCSCACCMDAKQSAPHTSDLGPRLQAPGSCRLPVLMCRACHRAGTGTQCQPVRCSWLPASNRLTVRKAPPAIMETNSWLSIGMQLTSAATPLVHPAIRTLAAFNLHIFTPMYKLASVSYFELIRP